MDYISNGGCLDLVFYSKFNKIPSHNYILPDSWPPAGAGATGAGGGGGGGGGGGPPVAGAWQVIFWS